MGNLFLKKVTKKFKQAGVEHLINKELSQEDFKFEILSNLFLLKEYGMADYIIPPVKWIYKHLDKINQTFKENPVPKEIIENTIVIVSTIGKRHHSNITLMTNLFSKKNYYFYYINENGEIMEEEITKEDLKTAKKSKSEYKIIHDKESENDFVYDLSYAKTIKMFHKPNTKKALAGVMTVLKDDKCVAYIESYNDDFHSKLIACKAANNAINAAINKQIIAVCIMGMIVQNNIHMPNMNRMMTMRRF